MHIQRLGMEGGSCHGNAANVTLAALQMAHVSWLILQEKRGELGIKGKHLEMFAARHGQDCAGTNVCP